MGQQKQLQILSNAKFLFHCLDIQIVSTILDVQILSIYISSNWSIQMGLTSIKGQSVKVVGSRPHTMILTKKEKEIKETLPYYTY